MSSIKTAKPASITSNQQGMVAILVAAMLIMVVGLIVLGLAQISRREQRNALNSQLSVQAYYAAESGINSARQLMLNDFKNNSPVLAKTSCGNDSNYKFSNVISASANVSFTCLLVDPTPPQLSYTLGMTPVVVPLKVNGGSFSSLTLQWRPAAGDATPYASCPADPGDLRSAGAWNCPYPMLRLDLVPINGPLSRDGLSSSTMTAFLVPQRAGGSASVPYANGGSANQGARVGAGCSSSSCSVTINGLSSPFYYMRLSALYRSNSDLIITGKNNAGGPVNFIDAQAVIDSTGKAQDVLRRVQVAVDISNANSNATSEAALVSSDSVCKRFLVTPSSFSIPPGITGTHKNNLFCQTR